MTVVIEMPAPQQNHLPAHLPVEAQDRIFPDLERVSLPFGKVMYESGEAMRNVYFPTDITRYMPHARVIGELEEGLSVG